jgi:NAD-specific glutamate dehydrogenase
MSSDDADYRGAGGVTSSSLEVLAGLALTTEEYTELMMFKDDKPSTFYQSYVKGIQAKISENAASEFACIWREYQRCGGSKTRTAISDELSQTLNALQDELAHSDLFDDEPSRKGVMRRAIPQTLVEKVGIEELEKRLPETYQRALFSVWVASHFVSLVLLLLCEKGTDWRRRTDLQVRRTGVKRRLFPLCARPCALSVRNSIEGAEPKFIAKKY